MPPPAGPAEGESHYAILGVPRNATEAALKSAYRAAAKLHHPDVNPVAAPDRFGRIAEAYDAGPMRKLCLS
jgi:curved DNA-binding protein CbpA